LSKLKSGVPRVKKKEAPDWWTKTHQNQRWRKKRRNKGLDTGRNGSLKGKKPPRGKTHIAL